MSNDRSLPTPPASAASPSSSIAFSTVTISVNLPVPRKHSLLPGSNKEIKLLGYLDDQLLRVVRRWEKRLPEHKEQPDSSRSIRDDAPGYENMDEVIADLDPLVDVVWISHTRTFYQNTLQVIPARVAGLGSGM